MSKHHFSFFFSIYLFIYLFNIYSILQCLRTHKKWLSIDQTFLLKLLSQNNKNEVSEGAYRLTLPLAACPWTLILVFTSFLINKNGWAVNLVPRALFKAREKRPGDEVVGRSVSVPKYLFYVYSILFQGNVRYLVSNILQFLAILVSYEEKSGFIAGLWRPLSQ